MILTRQQIESFKQNGCLIVNNIVNPVVNFGHLPKINSIVQQLGGSQFRCGDTQIAKIAPSNETWTIPDSHIDGYGPQGWHGGFMLGATTYLNNVESHGGAFCYWPGSHLTVHRFFLNNPRGIDGSFQSLAEWQSMERSFVDKSQEPVEFISQPGSVLFWHGFLVHAPSVNTSKQERVALIDRWHHINREQIKYDVPSDLWKYWNV